MNSRIRELVVRVRVPAGLAERRHELKRTAADALVVPVLEEVERRFHAGFGAAAILRVRALRMAWRVELSDLDASSLVSRLAVDVANGIFTQLQARSGRERLRPRSNEVAAFADASHATAAYLADAVDGRGDWWGHGSRPPPPTVWRELAGGGQTSITRVCDWLTRMERVDKALAAVPPEVIAELAGVVPIESHPPALVRAHHQMCVAGHVSVGAASAGGHPTSPEPCDAPVVRRFCADPGESRPPAGDRARVEAQAHQPPLALAADGKRPAIDTAHAGLFYLIGRVLEIDLAEHLWAAGLPEGDVLAHVAAAVLGSADDRVWCWFGGAIDRGPSAPAVASWAVDEISELTRHALGVCLARFGWRTTPAQLERSLGDLAGGFPPVETLDPGLARVVSWSAAALASVAAARLGESPSPALIRAVCHRPGSLLLDDGEMTVSVSSEYAAVEHRRAGLDHDPGYVPWLRRKVRFEFFGGAEM